MARYTKPKEGEWVKPVMKGYKMMCCDCGLVHRLDFFVKKWGRGHKVLFRAFRHVRATAAARRKARDLPPNTAVSQSATSGDPLKPSRQSGG